MDWAVVEGDIAALKNSVDLTRLSLVKVSYLSDKAHRINCMALITTYFSSLEVIGRHAQGARSIFQVNFRRGECFDEAGLLNEFSFENCISFRGWTVVPRNMAKFRRQDDGRRQFFPLQSSFDRCLAQRAGKYL